MESGRGALDRGSQDEKGSDGGGHSELWSEASKGSFATRVSERYAPLREVMHRLIVSEKIASRMSHYVVLLLGG
jgi:hypothetical protein